MTHTSALLIVRLATIPFEALEPLSGERVRQAADNWLARIEGRATEAERISELLHDAAGPSAPEERVAARLAVLRVRRAVHQDRTVEGRLLEEARALLPSDLERRVEVHREGAASIAQSRRDLSGVYAEERSQDWSALAVVREDPLFRLGLRLSGRALVQRADQYLRFGSALDQRGRHTASKLLAYLGRFTTKTSPNGVFCATALGALVEGDAVVEGPNEPERLDFLIHVGEARKITACLAVSPEARETTMPRINPTLRLQGSQWTLWKPASPRRPSDDEVRTEIKDHPVLRRFLDATARAESRERALHEVEAAVGRDVRPFYAQLVERGVLIDEVEIPWSERRPLRALAARCPEAPWAHDLEEIERHVDSLALEPLPHVEERMDKITSRLRSLPHERPLSEDDLVRCDASSRLRIRLPRILIRDLERLLPLYARFYGAIYPEALFRESYAERFLRRFPADTDVPVLDFYHGLFEPEGSARPAAFLSPRSGRSDSELRRRAGEAFDRARDVFARRAHEAQGDEVELTERDWDEIVGDAPEPRFSCALLFQVAARSLPDLRGPDARVCLNAIFPGAGLSVARLAHLHGDPIVSQLREGWARRTRPGTAFAEISFMHGGRTANAGLRPSLFPLEIELPGDRATEGREAISLADLTARWDSAARRFVLRSRSRDVEILPVVSSGISPEGIISFLTMAGAQGVQPLGLLPGFDVPEIRSWPRFRFGNVVLFRRRWVFGADEIPNAASSEEHYVAIQGWRREHRLPIHVFVHSDRDTKPFYVNLGSPAWVDLLRRATAGAEEGPARVHVTEMLPGPEELWVRDPRGRYATEFLAHMDHLA